MKHLLSILLSFVALAAFAQEATVKSVAADPLNIAASKYPMTDLNGHTAPLVIVEVLADNVEFKGNVLDGGVVRKTGEYWVYMGAGAKMLRIQSDKFLPVDIRFPDYGIPRLEPSATYVVRLALPQPALQSAIASHNYLVLTVSPADAKVTLDGELRELQDGTLRLLLRRNTNHEYLVEAPGYFPEQGTISIGADKTERTIVLRSHKGNLEVSSTTTGTEIYINGKKSGSGSWRGEVMPGDYLVEGRLAGHYSAQQLVTVSTGQKSTVTIPALIAATGSLNVDYRPDGASIIIDGTAHGTTPNVLDGIPAGPHSVTVSAPGYASATRDVTISDSELTTITGSLDPLSTPVATAASTQSTGTFSTTPIHLALCVAAPDGNAVYITAEQWQAIPARTRNEYAKEGFTPLGICLSQNGETFLVELRDQEKGKWIDWSAAMKYNLPTIEEGKVLEKNRTDLNKALKTFKGAVMDSYYWTRTEQVPSNALVVIMNGVGGIPSQDKTSTHRVRAVAPIPGDPAQISKKFSTEPVHLALCAAGPDGRTVYITRKQWQAFPISNRSSYSPKGICLSQNGETFLIEFRDKEKGKAMNWEEAMKYSLPTKDQSSVIAQSKEGINLAMRTFGGLEMHDWYWTRTEDGSSLAWLFPMYNGAGYVSGFHDKTHSHCVRAVVPVPAAMY